MSPDFHVFDGCALSSVYINNKRVFLCRGYILLLRLLQRSMPHIAFIWPLNSKQPCNSFLCSFLRVLFFTVQVNSKVLSSRFILRLSLGKNYIVMIYHWLGSPLWLTERDGETTVAVEQPPYCLSYEHRQAYIGLALSFQIIYLW